MVSEAEKIEREKLIEKITRATGKKPYGRVELTDDTSIMMNVYRGQVLRLEGREFYILGDVMEPRFGLDDQPKYWVKRAFDLADGSTKILKLVFYEEFTAHVGPIRIRCFRSPQKESRVLDLVRGDPRFMQGLTLEDAYENEVRVIDFIFGKTMYDHIFDLEMDHESYFHTQMPVMLQNFVGCMEAIDKLHGFDVCHGDIRNDHIIIDRDTGMFRWIDFDLSQHFPDYDVWSLGNLLAFIIGMGMRSFHEVEESDDYSPQVKASLSSSDASSFFHYRIMNLGKLFPYLPKKLNDMLMRFAVNSKIYYETVTQLVDDLSDALADLDIEG